MLQLESIDKAKFVSEEEFQKTVAENAELLERCKRGEARYSDSLGWLNVSKWAGPEQLDCIEALAAEIRGKADVFVLIGVGGSNNAARAVIESIAPESGVKIVYAGNTLSADAINRVLHSLDGHEVYIDCIAKNFETLEPGVSFRILRQYLVRRYGKEEAARRILCTGTPGSPLEALCRSEGYEFAAFPPDIGGRYTALSAVHLIPMAVAGVDVRALVRGAKGMERLLKEQAAEENIALHYAVRRFLYHRHGYKVEMLSAFEPRLAWFFEWWQQLFAESEGKDGKGLLPVTGEYSEQLHSLGQFVQDGTHLMFETFLDVKTPGPADRLIVGGTDVADDFDYLDGKNLWDVNKAAFSATKQAHSGVMPCLTLELGALDAAHYGALFYFFAFACYLSGSMLGVNPFDQPGVEAYKTQMFRMLGKRQKTEAGR